MLYDDASLLNPRCVGVRNPSAPSEGQKRQHPALRAPAPSFVHRMSCTAPSVCVAGERK